MLFSYSPLLFPLFAWLFSLAGTWLSLHMLAKWGVIDTPNARSNHRVPVPRGGGLGMIVSALIFMTAAGTPLPVIFTALFLALVSFADDVKNLPVKLRLFAQLIAVMLALSSLPGRIFPASIPLPCEQIFLALAWIWFINLTNFMDGIDGISAMQAILMTVGICLLRLVLPSLPMTLPLEASIIAAAAFGFYLFNRPPARLFMGDAGSVPLGFLLGYLLLSLAARGAWIPALILPAYYLSDATITLLLRLFRKERIWTAHSDHAYQQAARAGLSHWDVVSRITWLNLLLVVLAMLAAAHMIAGVFLLIFAYFMTACLIYRFIHASALQ